MTTNLRRSLPSTTLLTTLLDSPQLLRVVRELPAAAFSALVRHIGVEDAGEVVALATTPQLVAAFDEDLFVNARAGERETFDASRFAVWLEVLLEAGDEIAAHRIAELSEDFVVHALASLVLVLDHDALRARMGEGGDDAFLVDKAIESSLSEEIDGYLLISRRGEGWDAALALIVALDRDHRSFLVRVLDRCADMASGYIDDLEELADVLSSEESAAEDAEAEREQRRSKQGFVEPRAAKNFLALARQPMSRDSAIGERDAVTRAYFRELERAPTTMAGEDPLSARLLAALRGVAEGAPDAPWALPRMADSTDPEEGSIPIVEAVRLLRERDASLFGERMEELAYLTNVLVAGSGGKHGRFRPAEAAEAVLATVAFGAALTAATKQNREQGGALTVGPVAIDEVLRQWPADLLFRRASSILTAERHPAAPEGFLYSRKDVARALALLDTAIKRSPSRKKPPKHSKPARARRRFGP
jgi:hypothetical protein